MSEIYRIENYLQEPFRKTAKNRDVIGGWSTLDDASVRESPGPDMFPNIYSFDSHDISLTASMSEEFIAAHRTRAKRVYQYCDDLFDVYYQRGYPIYAKPDFADLMRELDGEAHEFVGPVKLWSMPDERIAERQYTAIHVRRLVPTIDLDRSRVDKVNWHPAIKEPPNKKPYFWSLKALTPEGQVVFRSALAAGLSVWRDRDTRSLFCTDDFRKRAKKIGHRGLKFTECTVVDR